MMSGNERGQVSALEYAVVVAAVVVVMIGISVYFKWTLQGGWKANADQVGQQFSPRWSNYEKVTHAHERSQTTENEDGSAVTTLLDHAVARTDPYLDDFSGVRLRDERLDD